MTVYLDIGARRIQAYLARTPQLRARRGASAMLEYSALRSATEPSWRDHAVVNNEGKQTDGVLSLRFTDDAVSATTEQTVVARTIAALREQAPGAEWEIRISRAADYHAAREASEQAERAGRELVDSGGQRLVPAPPAVGEIPVVRICDSCGVDRAVGTGPMEPGGEQKALCADCQCRLVTGGSRGNRRNWTQLRDDVEAPGGLGAERALVDAVATAGRKMSVAREFGDLAALGDDDANHLCTVYLDGNRFGSLLSELKQAGVSLHDLSTGLAAAVAAAVATATIAVTRDQDAHLPVVPHLIGGDDLLASVTADRAWAFTTAFLADYHRRTAELVAGYAPRKGAPVTPPTASAGLVFAHYKFPFASALDLADAALRRAKGMHCAKEPAVCWVDVTEDGPALPRGRGAPTVAALTSCRAELVALRAVSPSGRAQLARAAGAGSGDQRAAERVAGLAARLGTGEEVRPFLLPGQALSLADALVLGRWWR